MQLKKLWHSNHKLFTTLACLLLAMSLTACDNDKKTVETQVEPAEDTSIILSPDGIGPINSTTSFNMHQMTLAFSDYSVVEEVSYLEGRPFPAIKISEGVNTILNIIPDESLQGIYSVIVEDNIIKNSLGHHLGALYSNVYTYGQNEECQPGIDDLAGKMLCYAPKYPNILYVFNGAWENVAVGKVPPADILQTWSLESIIWRPKS